MSTEAKKRVLVVGGVTFNDMVYMEDFPEPRPQTVFSKHHLAAVGGTGAGKALNLNRLGYDVSLHALIGDDDNGAFIRDVFQRESLHFDGLIDLQGTERHINLMNAHGDRISIYTNYATYEPEIDLSLLEGRIQNSDIIALNIINYCRRLIPVAKRHNKPLWVDIHDYDGKSDYHKDFIEGADVLFLSSDQLPDYREFMQEMFDKGKKLIVCTHGKNGATALDADGWHSIYALPVELVDTNGAGDSFFSGFLHGYLQGKTTAECLRYGVIVAGLCVTSTQLFSEELNVNTVEEQLKRFNDA